MNNQQKRGRLASFLWPEPRLKSDFPWSITKSAKTYGIALAFYFAGTFIPALLIFGGLFGLAYARPDFAEWLIEPQVISGVIVFSTILSFLTGFGAEVWYISKVLAKDGLSLRKQLGLSLDTLNGSRWAAIGWGVVTYGVIMAVDRLASLIPMPEAHDPAASFLSSLTGLGFAAVTMLVILGPIFEEIVFRGFLYSSVRSSLQNKGRVVADIIALLVSALAFSLLHFNLSGLLAYFVAGAILAESYRRSGSLYVPIVAHCLNNATAVILLIASSS